MLWTVFWFRPIHIEDGRCSVCRNVVTTYMYDMAKFRNLQLNVGCLMAVAQKLVVGHLFKKQTSQCRVLHNYRSSASQWIEHILWNSKALCRQPHSPTNAQNRIRKCTWIVNNCYMFRHRSAILRESQIQSGTSTNTSVCEIQWQVLTYLKILKSSSSLSCSWRVRRVSCSLILKMKLVPPSLTRSSFCSIL
jgi:hypothetical protein